jgi:enoyl-CoA hydratase
MQFEQINYEVKKTTAIVTLNRPEKRNALSAQLLRELSAALLEADEHNAVHCVVLRGAGPHFCAGADLSEYSSGRGEAYRGRQEIDDDVWRLEHGQRLRLTLFDMHKPVIAQVHGTCIGIGTDLAWLCDMVLVADDDARIGFPPVRDLGTPPGSMWLYHCGPQWAKRLLLTGDSVTGADAASIGLALKAVPADQLEAEVMRLAERMGLVDPHLLSANKRLVNLGLELMGARTLQRVGAEIDARGHLAPKARAFRETMREHGVKFAFQKRDAAFGKGYAAVHGPDPD